jgi:hypothetical protein
MKIEKLVSHLAEKEALELKNIVDDIRDEKTLLKVVADVAKIYDDCCMAKNRNLIESTCVHNRARKYLDGNKED